MVPVAAGASPNGGTAAPVLVNLADVQQTGQVQDGISTFKHPSGQAKLDQEKAQAQSNAPTSGIQTAPASVAPQATTAGPSFDGISDAESFCNCFPPDGAIGIGPNHVVAAVNTAFKIWDKTGVNLRPSTALSSLFSHNPACLANISDPSSQYDPASGGHFILEALTYNSTYTSSICIAVSTTSDPTGSYWVYGFGGPSRDLLDFPQLAIGSDAIYVAVNQFQNATTFTGARVYAYNKSQLESGATASAVFHDVGNDAAGFIADSLYPAKGVTVANTAYFLGVENNFATGNNISLWKWTNPFGVNSFTLRGGVTVTTYAQPPPANFPGGTTDTGDVRNLGAAFYQGTVYGAHTIGCNPGGGTVPCLQWYQLGNIDTAPTPSQQGILGGTGQSRYYPNLSVDTSGDMIMGYAYASSSEYPGVRFSARQGTDPINTLQAETVAKAGEGFIDGTRYGDYAGEQVDTDGCTVWHLEEYAKAGVFWGTWIASTKFAGCGGPPPTPDFSMAATPSSQTITQGATTSYTVNINRTGGFTGPVTLSASGTPSGASAGFNPNNTTLNSSTMTVTTTSTTPTGSYPLTITGTSGTLSHSTGVTLVVNPPPTPDFSLSATPSSVTVTQGSPATYTVNISRSGGFTGSVTLSTSPLPSGAAATLNPNPATGNSSTLTLTTAASTSTGTYTITITGVSGSLTHTTTAALVVNPPPDFTLSTTPTSGTVTQGSPATYTVNINRVGGFTGSVTLSTSPLPTGATATFNPNPATGNSSALIVTTAATTATGTYTITITGVSGALTHTTTATLVVNPAPAGDYSLFASPGTVSIKQGTSASSTISITRTGGFTGAVTFSVSGLPAGATGTFSPNPSTGASSTLTLTAGNTTPTGSYLLTITGVSSGLTHSTTVTLTVTQGCFGGDGDC